MKISIRSMWMGALAGAVILGCGDGASEASFAGKGTPPPGSFLPGDPNEGLGNPEDPLGGELGDDQCREGRIYTGIGGRVLVATRNLGDEGTDRLRVKPYSALAGEFTRVLGTTPALLQSSAGTFGQPVARWYEEPGVSAITLYTSYRVSFQGCLTFTAQPTEYATAPTDASAQEFCSTLARKFWSREPSAEELQMCKQVALTDTTTEQNSRRRWAYTCASLLSTSGFLSY